MKGEESWSNDDFYRERATEEERKRVLAAADIGSLDVDGSQAAKFNAMTVDDKLNELYKMIKYLTINQR